MKTLGLMLLVIGFANFAQASCPYKGELIDTNVAVQGYSAPAATPGHSCMDQVTQAVCQADGTFNYPIFPHCQSKPQDCGDLAPGTPVYGFAWSYGTCSPVTVTCMPDGHLSGPVQSSCSEF